MFRHLEFLKFLQQVTQAYPRQALHVVCDHYRTHTRARVRPLLERNPRIILHFTPTSGSWLNLVEIFGDHYRQAICRGSLTSVKDLINAIRIFIDGRCYPFTWIKDADTILASAQRSPKAKTAALRDTSFGLLEGSRVARSH